MLVYDILCDSLQHKKIKASLEVLDVFITYVTNRGNARVMLHVGQVIAITVK